MNKQEKTKEELIIELDTLQKEYDSLKETFNVDTYSTVNEQDQINENDNIRFKKLIEHAPIAMAIVNMTGEIEFINHKAVTVFGYKHQDIPTMERWWSLAYPDEEYRNEVVADWMGRIQKALTDNIEIVGNEYLVTCKDKTVKSVFISGIPVSEKIFVLFDDITKRKQDEQELIEAKFKVEESEQSYRLLINSIPNTSILLFDKNLRYLIAGGGELEKSGFDKSSSFHGKTLQEAFPKDVVDLFEPLYFKALNGESTAFEMDYGDLTYFQQVIPVHNAEKEIFAGTVIAQNITTTKQAQKAIIENQRLNAIGEMAASIAHDFNNSLQMMIGNIEVAKLETKLPNTTLKHLNNIASIISDVAARVKSVQRFGDAKLERKDNKLVKLNTIINESILQLHPLWKDNIQKRGMKISIKTDYGDIPEIYSNEGELKTSFHNVIKNSIEAMPEGGIINIVTRKKGEGVYVTIADTGIGMDEVTRLKIFQPFFTTKGFDVGRGLGMSGVYSIMKECGGGIFVKETGLDKGTIIELVFPLNEQEVRKEEKDTAAKVLNKEVALRVLWVEDEALIRLNSKRMVKSMGHKCDIASSGKKALEYLNKNTYDIVITDIGMPEMNGWQLADKIKEKFGGKIKIAVISGWNIEEKEKIAHGIKWVLEKPFQIDNLRKLFEDVQ